MSTSRSEITGNRIGRKLWIPIGCLALIFAFFVLIPSFNDTTVAKNEATAVGSIRKIQELENAFATAHPDKGFACQLKQLRPTENMPDVYDNSMNVLAGEWVGYKFEVAGCIPEKNGVVARYQVTAVPLSPLASGVRAFCADQSGNVFYDHNGSATECMAARQLLP
jgi:type IV pilus assembly protein PilA